MSSCFFSAETVNSDAFIRALDWVARERVHVPGNVVIRLLAASTPKMAGLLKCLNFFANAFHIHNHNS